MKAKKQVFVFWRKNKFSRIYASVLLAMLLSTGTAFCQEHRNVALKQFGTQIKVSSASANPFFVPDGVIDGDVSDDSAIRLTGVPADIELTFIEEREVNRLRIYPGILVNSSNPSGICAPLLYEIDGYVNNGWTPLVKSARMPPLPNTDKADDYFVEHKFPIMYLSKLRLRILASGDTGRRATAPGKRLPAGQLVSAIREIQVFESIPGKHELQAQADYLTGDFRLPFYRQEEQAVLTLVTATSITAPLEAAAVILAADGRTVLRRIPFKIVPGTNNVSLNIAGLESGRYPVNIEVKRTDSTEILTRLLRIDRGVNAPAAEKVFDVTGRRLYLFDDYQTANRDNLTVQVNPARPYLAAWMKLAPDQSHWNNRIGALALTNDNKLTLAYQDWTSEGYRWRHAVCSDPNNLTHWEIRPGNTQDGQYNATMIQPSPTATGRWQLKTSLEKAKFRFYDPSSDGVPPLDKIYILHTGVKRRQFGGLPIPYRSTYAVWEKNPGEILFLSRSPLVTDAILPGGNLFEGENDTSDNFGGQHLSEDGRTLYYIVGRVVKRFPPFSVGYDNQRFSCRLLTTYYTQDGFNWKKQFILPVSRRDPWSLQQYGAQIFRDPKADLYWGFLASYNAQKQQMYIDIMFSRDLLSWTRPGDQPFIAGSETPDDWRFGLILPGMPMLRHGDREYLFMRNVLSWPHFYHETRQLAPNDIRHRYASRGLEAQWPYFKFFGSYEKLAESMKLAYSRRPVGVAETRPGGYIALAAGTEPGKLVTRLLQATGGMTLNGKTASDGWIKAELLDSSGLPLTGRQQIFRGDSLNGKLFNQLPKEPFRLRITMRNAELFAIDCIESTESEQQEKS